MRNQFASEKIEFELLFDKKFSKVRIELDTLISEAGLEKGGWIFKSHLYTAEELLNSPRISRIHSISEKIGDDVLSWAKSGKLTQPGFEAYRKKRNAVNRSLREVRKKIEYRKPHKWEVIVSVFDDTSKILMRLFPTVANLLKLATKLIEGTSDSTKLLPKP